MAEVNRSEKTLQKNDTGYRKKKDPIGKDSANKLKDRIKGLSFETFAPFVYTGSNKITIRYRLLSPEGFHPDLSAETGTRQAVSNEAGTRQTVSDQTAVQKATAQKAKYPLVLVLHGSGAAGTDNIAQMGILAKLWAFPGIREKYPAYIVVPQFPHRSSNYAISPERQVLVSVPDPCLTTAHLLIDSLKKTLPVDEKKIYVIGFSMGGSGVINSLGLRPDLFAAGISISGIPDFDHIQTLAKTPLWLIHGNADNENPLSSDSLLYKELSSLPEHHLKFWEIDQLDHRIFSPLYTGDLIPRWLFRQIRITGDNSEGRRNSHQ